MGRSPAMAALMSSRSAVAPLAFAIGMLLISMVSYQCGASLAKHLFPQVGAQGATAYRLGFSALILLLWRGRGAGPALVGATGACSGAMASRWAR